MANTYGIYYGQMVDGKGAPNAAAKRIAAARLPLLICTFTTIEGTPRENMNSEVLSLMKSAGTAVYAQVATGWGRSDLESVKQQAAESLAQGADGIFFNETGTLEGDYLLDYYKPLADLVRGQGKSVIVNPGTAKLGASITEVGDLIMVGHDWRRLQSESPWAAQCCDRFMGVSRNDNGGMGYFVDLETAVRDTREAFAGRFQWHTSTDKFAYVPEWFERYVAAVRD